MKVYKACIMGSGGVGKSSLVMRFMNGCFSESYDPTIEDSYRKSIKVDNEHCLLEVIDTAGIDQFEGLHEHLIEEADGFILVFSLSDQSTLDDIISLKERIESRKSRCKEKSNIPVVLVGNKVDIKEKRSITNEDGQKIAKLWNCKYIETSAREDTNIYLPFQEIVRQIRRSLDPKNDILAKLRPRKCTIL